MDQISGEDSSSHPKDAREATEEQREVQDELDHQNDDPGGPGSQQSRHDIADET